MNYTKLIGLLFLTLCANKSFAITLPELRECAKTDTSRLWIFKDQKDFLIKAGELLSSVAKELDDENHYPNLNEGERKKLLKTVNSSKSCSDLSSTLNAKNINSINKILSIKHVKNLDDFFVKAVFTSEAEYKMRKLSFVKYLKEAGYLNVASGMQYKYNNIVTLLVVSDLSSVFNPANEDVFSKFVEDSEKRIISADELEQRLSLDTKISACKETYQNLNIEFKYGNEDGTVVGTDCRKNIP